MLGPVWPNVAVETARSSSLTADDIEIPKRFMGAGAAANLNQIPGPSISIGIMRELSGDGRYKIFDASASGYVHGEGCGAVRRGTFGQSPCVGRGS